MNITISPEAMDYLKQNNHSALFVELIEYGGCGGSHFDLSVLPGVPETVDNFDLIPTRGIDVYLYKNAEQFDESGLKIYLVTEHMMFKTLHASGLRHIDSTFDLFGA